MMEEKSCENCVMKAKYDAKPKSLIGRFWRWHISFCPGWKDYMKSLDEEKRKSVINKYHLK